MLKHAHRLLEPRRLRYELLDHVVVRAYPDTPADLCAYPYMRLRRCAQCHVSLLKPSRMPNSARAAQCEVHQNCRHSGITSLDRIFHPCSCIRTTTT